MLRKNFTVYLLSALLMWSCSQTDTHAGEDNIVIENDTLITSPEVAAEQDVNAVLNGWNNAFNDQNYDIFSTYYAEDVSIDGKVVSGEEAAEIRKKQVLDEAIHREKLDKVITEAPSENVRKLSFTKHVMMANSFKSVNTVLILEKQAGIWKITAEKNEPVALMLPDDSPRSMPESQITSCREAAIAVFLSAPMVKELLKDEKMKYRIEFSPEDQPDPAKNYSFWVYQPHDGMSETYGRFILDPVSGKLDAEDQASGSLTHLKPDAGLIKHLKKYCGN